MRNGTVGIGELGAAIECLVVEGQFTGAGDVPPGRTGWPERSYRSWPLAAMAVPPDGPAAWARSRGFDRTSDDAKETRSASPSDTW